MMIFTRPHKQNAAEKASKSEVNSNQFWPKRDPQIHIIHENFPCNRDGTVQTKVIHLEKDKTYITELLSWCLKKSER